MFKKLIFTIIISLLIPSVSIAGSIEKLKEGYGYVVIAIDENSPAHEKNLFNSPLILMFQGLRIMKYDSNTKTIPDVSLLFRSPNEVTLFQIVDKSNGKRYWIGQMRENDAAIAMFHYRFLWGTCFNSGTKYFHVKQGEFNLIGKLDTSYSFIEMQKAADEGKLPQSVSRYSNISVLYDTELKGFTTVEQSPEIKNEVDAFLSEYLKKPIITVAPTVETIGFNIGKTKKGETSCFSYHKE